MKASSSERKLQEIAVDEDELPITFDEFVAMISSFSFLVKLDVSCLGFEGTLTDELAKLFNLEILDVSFNFLEVGFRILQ